MHTEFWSENLKGRESTLKTCTWMDEKMILKRVLIEEGVKI